MVCFLDGDKVYIERWVEQSWDVDHDRATDDYDFYDMFIVKDRMGNVIFEGIGSLYQREDGTWWMG